MDSPDAKIKHDLEEDSLSLSEPSADLEPESHPEAESSQVPPQPQKRKGGRKPIYATSEERKQRNRQAQAAFRERRTEYIKQLEINLKQNEQLLQNLQQSNQASSEECHNLQYKNSLLERILLEKGYDVNAELNAKGALQNFPPKTASLPQKQDDPSLQASNLSQASRRHTVGLAQRQDMQTDMPREGASVGPSPINGMVQAPPWQYPTPTSPATHQPPGFSSNSNSPDPRYPHGLHQQTPPANKTHAQSAGPSRQQGPPGHAQNFVNVVGPDGPLRFQPNRMPESDLHGQPDRPYPNSPQHPLAHNMTQSPHVQRHFAQPSTTPQTSGEQRFPVYATGNPTSAAERAMMEAQSFGMDTNMPPPPPYSMGYPYDGHQAG